ncbi:MAG: UDP-N-acetylglucosamine 2-epimerase (hydrolyzing) [Methanomicrobiaceae archaeon]|nr:UDP-N-acetylglucosamine 2-epimerase (hydrolyzing) [Methanomicrobiaceae archaeon]
MTRNICAITGSRSEYGILRPVLLEIEKNSDLKLSLIVTGMHLSEQHGHTIDEIYSDGFPIGAVVEMTLDGSGGSTMAKSTGIGIMGLSQAFQQIKPDIILIVGDRCEVLAASVAAIYMNIPIAHIHGGDKSAGGHADDSIRHAVSKIAHIHFPVSKESHERLLNLGEENFRTFYVGSPVVDIINQTLFSNKADIFRKYGLNPEKKMILLVQNPVTYEYSHAGEQLIKTLNALKEVNIQTLLVYPNSDMGSKEMISVIKEFEKFEFLKTFKNINHKDFLNLMKCSDLFIGNSSSALIESPFFGTPVVDIGSRQKGRERAENVLHAEYNETDILEKINKSLYDEDHIKKCRNCSNPYGDGYASEKIASVLAEIEINNKLMVKEITY